MQADRPASNPAESITRSLGGNPHTVIAVLRFRNHWFTIGVYGTGVGYLSKTDYAAWLSTSQAARALGVSGEMVRQWAEDGTLENVLETVNGRLYDPDEVQALAQERGGK